MNPSEDNLRRRRALASASRFLQREAPRTQAEILSHLATTAPDTLPDLYGEYGDIEALESEVASVLGKPAAVFMPTGTMAQQCALRIWADRTGHRTAGVHGMSHLVVHEERALEAMHGIRMEHLSSAPRPLSPEDFKEFPHPLGSLSIELPLRDAGYQLPPWEQLSELAGAARDRGVPVHLDGARIWESQPFFDRPLSDIAALGDSVYVSFYKGLGGIAGAALAGPVDFVAEARHWQHRHGGTMVSAYPLVIAALDGLRTRIGRFAEYADRARGIADTLGALPGVRVFPNPPHTNAFVLFTETSADGLNEATLQLAESEGLMALGPAFPADVPGWTATEFVVGEATADWSDEQIADVFTRLIDDARRLAPVSVNTSSGTETGNATVRQYIYPDNSPRHN